MAWFPTRRAGSGVGQHRDDPSHKVEGGYPEDDKDFTNWPALT